MGGTADWYRHFGVYDAPGSSDCYARWDDVSRTVPSRAMQTNGAGRCATLLPSLALIAAAAEKPLALLEVGASAGLTLYPDKYPL